MQITPAPYIKARRAPRPHGLVGAKEIKDLKLDGDLWLRNRHGIVVYLNPAIPLGEQGRIHLVPRNITMERVPGYWPPPAEYHHADGTWTPIDWIREPRAAQRAEDPYVARVLFLRRVFFEIRRGHRTGQWRAYDIWPQAHEGQGPIWPWENSAVLPEG